METTDELGLFVPYRFAKMAATCGFKEPCLMIITTNEGIFPTSKEFNFNYDEFVNAPTYDQLIEWFNDNHKLVIETRRNSVDKFFHFIIKDENCNVEIFDYNQQYPTRKLALRNAFSKAFALIQNS